MHKLKRESERRLKPDDSVRSPGERVRRVEIQMRLAMTRTEESADPLHLLRVRIVRRVVGCDHIDCAVANRGEQSFNVRVTSEWRIHLGVRSPDHRGALVQSEMMRRNFARYLRTMTTRSANQVERRLRGDMGDVNRRAGADR